MQPFLHRSGTPAAPSTYSPNLVISVESALTYIRTYIHTHRHRPIHFKYAYVVNMRIHAYTYEHTYESMPYRTQNLYFEYINIADIYIKPPIERTQQDFVGKNQVERNEPN